MSSDYIIKTVDIIDSETQNLINTFLSSSSSLIIDVEQFLKESLSIDITTDPDIIKGYDHDWSNLKGYADALCRPKNKVECAIVMRVCYMLNVSMTISAGRTNLTGSATPNGGIIISISEMDNIGNIDYKNNNIDCSPGVYLEDLRTYVTSESQNKLEFSVDPTSRKEAMVGGAISCNASGFVPGEKGAMRYWINGLDFLLPNGEMIKINRGEYISSNGEFVIHKTDNTESIIKVPSYNRIDLKNATQCAPRSTPLIKSQRNSL